MATTPTEVQEPKGSIVGSETGTPKGTAQKPEQQEQDYGPNNEKLPDDLKQALYRLIQEYKNEVHSARRDEVRRIRQAREFWKGLQYVYWAESSQSWQLPTEQRTTNERAESPRYSYVTNIYQAFGLSLISVLSQDVPRVRLWPQSSEQLEDVATAESGTDVIELVERNNHMEEMMVDEAFTLWTDGKVGGYVRYVTDGSRFGFHPEDEMDSRQVKMGEDVFQCPQCQEENPVNEYLGFCATCGAELSEENLSQAPLVDVPNIQETIQMPNGAEVISIIGGLELKTPMYANEQHEFAFLTWQMEVHRARLRAGYPHAKTKISGAVTTGEGATDTYERTFRMSLVHGGQLTEGGDVTTNLITYERTWLRSWAFDLLQDDKLRDRLVKLFPTGCYVAFAGDVYLESRNESMDDHWRVMHALPGDGQNRPALGTSMISVQERYNTLTNLTIETAEYGIPTTYADSDVLDFDSLPTQEVIPGSYYPVTRQGNQRISDAFYTTEPTKLSPDVRAHAAELTGPIGQFLSGAFPALFGGEAQGAGGDTAAGYAMQRDQAMGRIGMVWRRMKSFHADLMMLAVDVFRKNRPDDVEMTVFGPGGKFTSKWIRMADLKGNVNAYAESDEQYPAIWSQKRAVLLKLLESPDPMIQAMLGHPDNLKAIKRLVGLEDFVVPDEDSRNKQFREIHQLLSEQPSAPPVGLGLAEEGQMQMPPMPSIVPDVFGDNHAVELETVKSWMNSDAGQAAKEENPPGFENVRLHGMLHEQIWNQQQQAMAMQQAAAQQAGAAPAEGAETP